MGSCCTKLSNYMGGWCPRKLNSMGGWVKIRCRLPPHVFFSGIALSEMLPNEYPQQIVSWKGKKDITLFDLKKSFNLMLCKTQMGQQMRFWYLSHRSKSLLLTLSFWIPVYYNSTDPDVKAAFHQGLHCLLK